MKKYLIVLAVALVALAGCKEKEGSYSSIRIKQAEVSIGVGESAKLNLLYEPTTLEAPKVTWASSNTDVATVDQNGNVTGVAFGEANITATLDKLSAVCHVSVKDAYSLVEWDVACLWGINKTPLSDDTVEVTLTSGDTVHCVPIMAQFRVWSSGLTFDADDEAGGGLYLAGEGFLSIFSGSALLITEDLGKGPNYYYVGRDEFRVVSADEYDATQAKYAYCAPAGVKDLDAQALFDYWFNDTIDESPLPQPWYGAEIMWLNADSLTYSGITNYGEPLAAFLGEGRFVDGGMNEDNTIQYPATEFDFDVNWFDCLGEGGDTFSFRGLKAFVALDEETEQYYWDIVTPLEWADTFTRHYTLLPESASRANKGYTIRPVDKTRPITMPKLRYKASDTKVLKRK